MRVRLNSIALLLSTPLTENSEISRWQYMAEHDVPAVLDKIDEVTKQEKVYMIGHCIGATLLFAFLSNERFIKYHERVMYCSYPLDR